MNDNKTTGNRIFRVTKGWGYKGLKYDESFNEKEFVKSGFETKETAILAMQEADSKFKVQQSRWTFSHNKNPTLMEYLEYWMNLNSYYTSGSTQMVYYYMVRRFIFPYIHGFQLKKLTASNVNLFYERLTDAGGTKPTLCKVREILCTALNDAVKHGYINRNPVVNSKRFNRNSKRAVILNRENLKTFLVCAQETNWYLEVLLGLFCGLRKGEISGLDFDNFDFKNNFVTIEKQYTQDYRRDKELGVVCSGASIKPPKTVASYRTISVPKVVMQEVARRKELAELLSETTQMTNYGYLSFNNTTGNRRGVVSFNKAVETISLSAHVEKVNPHSLRHMYATLLIEQGESLERISALMGHASIHTTFEIYCDVFEQNREIARFIDNTFANAYIPYLQTGTGGA